MSIVVNSTKITLSSFKARSLVLFSDDFDCSIFACCKQKPGAGEGLGSRLFSLTNLVPLPLQNVNIKVVQVYFRSGGGGYTHTLPLVARNKNKTISKL